MSEFHASDINIDPDQMRKKLDELTKRKITLLQKEGITHFEPQLPIQLVIAAREILLAHMREIHAQMNYVREQMPYPNPVEIHVKRAEPLVAEACNYLERMFREHDNA